MLCMLLALSAFASSGSGELVSPKWIAICIGVGFLLALIPMAILKGQIRNVHNKTEATNYTREGSFNLYGQQDSFLYSNVTAVPIPRSNDNK